MCGYIGTNFKIKNPNSIIKTLIPRGPDFCDFKYINDIFLAHCRLSIIDTKNKTSNQPYIKDEIAIIFNGTIYNYRQLQINHNLPIQNSDTITIVNLYEKYGVDFLNLLNGSFSFCIYDKSKDLFFCARDRYGKKPLFFYHKDGKFIVSSLIKSIINVLSFTPKMNKVALNQYLQYFVPIEDNTFYQNINKLPAGHYIIFNNSTKELKTKKYYKIDTTKSIFDKYNAIDNIKDLLIQSISDRLIGDKQIATLLSGGVDSSLVSAIYSKISSKTIDTFSVGYNEYKKYDELKYANIVSKHINSNHTEVLVSKDEFIDTIDEIIDVFYEPHGDSASIPLYLLSKKIKDSGFDIILSGEGSDELFLGYKTYSTMIKFNNFKKTLSNEQIEFLKTLTPSLLNNTKESEYLQRIAKGEFIYNSFGETFNNSHKAQLLKKAFFYNQKPKSKDFIDSLSLIDLDIWLGNALLSKVDMITAHNGLETRTPFLDFKIVQECFKIDSNIKLGDTSKYIIKQIASEFLPLEIVNRSKKGFSTPSNEWLLEKYQNDVLNTILEVSLQTGLFKNEFIYQIWHLALQGKFRQHLWMLYIFARWFKKIYL